VDGCVVLISKTGYRGGGRTGTVQGQGALVHACAALSDGLHGMDSGCNGVWDEENSMFLVNVEEQENVL